MPQYQFFDRVKFRVFTEGTGAISFDDAITVTSYRSWEDAGAEDGTATGYGIQDGEAWEIGHTVLNLTNNTMTRDVLASSNDNAALDLSGRALVMCVYPADDITTTQQLADAVASAQEDADAAAVSAAAAAVSAASSAANGATVIGMPAPWPSNTPPTNWLLMNGQEVSRTTYAALFAVWGTIGGVGDGTTTFNIPDWRGRFLIGASGSYALNSTGGAASVTTSSSGAHTHTVTVDNHTLTSAEMPSHAHSVETSGNVAPTSGQRAGKQTQSGDPGTFNTGSTGGGGAHNHTASTASDGAHTHTAATLPPYFAINWIVRAL